MSNRVILQGCTFNYTNGSVSHGYTISDDYAVSFDNSAEGKIEDDFELLAYARKTADKTARDMFDNIVENEKGILINDNWYDWEQIKEVFE